MLKTIRGRLGGNTGKVTKQVGINGPYKHETRSMDVGISQPTLGLQIDTAPTDGRSSRTASSMSTSPAALCDISPQSTWEILGETPVRIPVRLAKSESAPAKARPTGTSTAGLVTNDRVTVHVQTAVGVPDIVVSGSPLPVEKIANSNQTEAPSTTAPAIPAKISPTRTKNLPDVPRVKNTPPPALPTIDTSSRPPPTPQSSSPPSNVSLRRATPRITDMPPSAFVMNKEGSVRLSPSIIMRPMQPPFPLPKIPVSLSRPLPPPPRPQSRLRSIPALSVDGTNELDQEADHDYTDLGDSDEDDEGDETNGGSDEDGEDLTQTRGSHSDLRPALAPTRRPDLPAINMTPFDLSLETSRLFVANRSPILAHLEGEMTPTASNSFDYFSVKPLPSPSGTTRVENATPGPSTNNHNRGHYPMTTPSSPVLSRPSIRHQVSRSMVDLTFPKELLLAKDLDSQKVKGKGKAPAQHDAFGPAPAYFEGTLRRRRSMPTYNATSEPPPYPIFARRDHVVILPRDEEGMERLPDYSNSIHLTAIMPRKMEFSAPGVQAKDRKWRRTLCELQGTAFRVYRCPAGAAGVGIIGEWWEKKVGVGDVAISGPSGIAVEDVLASETVEARPSKTSPDNGVSSVLMPSGSRRTSDTLSPQATPVPKPKGLAASLLHPVTRGGSSPAQSYPHSRSQSEASGPGLLGIARSTTRSSSQLYSSPASTSNQSVVAVGSSTGSEASSPSRSSFLKPGARNSVSSFNRPTLDLSNPDPADLIRAYTLQNAESGLGSDYTKRKNVIRVRMEGEQFLLQAQGVAEVVEWIEVGCIYMKSRVGCFVNRLWNRAFMLLLTLHLTWTSGSCPRVQFSLGLSCLLCLLSVLTDCSIDEEDEDVVAIQTEQIQQLPQPIPLSHRAIFRNPFTVIFH